MAVLSTAARKKLPSKSFALPGKGTGPSGKGAGSYPVPDASHARNALARVSQYGSPAEQKTVRAKVHAKFPGIGRRQGGGPVYSWGGSPHQTFYPYPAGSPRGGESYDVPVAQHRNAQGPAYTQQELDVGQKMLTPERYQQWRQSLSPDQVMLNTRQEGGTVGPGFSPGQPGESAEDAIRRMQRESFSTYGYIKGQPRPPTVKIPARQAGGGVTPLPITPGPQAGAPTRAEIVGSRTYAPRLEPTLPDAWDRIGWQRIRLGPGPRGYAEGGAVSPGSQWSQMGHALRRAKGGKVAPPAIGDRKLREGPPRYPKIARDYV